MDEKVTANTFVNGKGKLHLNDDRIHYSSHVLEYEFNRFFHREVINLLLNVYEETVSPAGLSVRSIFRHSSLIGGIQNPSCTKDTKGVYRAFDNNVISEFEYNGVEYLAEFKTELDRSGFKHYLTNYSYSAKQIPDDRIGFALLKLAFAYTSEYNKGCIEINFNREREAVSYVDAEFVTPPESCLENVFVRNEIKDDIQRFIYTFKNFEQHRIPLRFLLSGNPGLGKTEIIRAVINECSKSGLVIIPKEMNGADWLTFEYAKLFSPALVCIDDVDLIYGKRENGFRKTLNSFLRMLDGILQNNFFLIATTNDKKLVDEAASRPGRFDDILDFGDFEKRFYKDIINARTQDEKILVMLDEEVQDFLEGKKVTGAYIVNLIKQVQIMLQMNPDYSKQDLMKYINRNYRGFYKSQVEQERNFGFSN